MQTSTITTALAGAIPQMGLPPGAAAPSSGDAPFAGALQTAVHSMQQLDQQASTATQGLISGQGVDLHQAMIATQKADTAFEFALAVRNKAVGAYQQIMNLQF